MNRSQMNGLHQPPIQDAYMDDGSGPSSHEDESPLKEFRTLNVLGFKSKAKTTKGMIVQRCVSQRSFVVHKMAFQPRKEDRSGIASLQ